MDGESKMSEPVNINTKLTAKQEEAVQTYLFHSDNSVRGNKSAAYRHAYNAENMSDGAVWVEAYRLFARPHVSLRVQELRQLLYSDVTVESLLAEYEDGQQLAKNEGQAAAYIGAVTAKAKLLGLLEDKVHQETVLVDARSAKPVQFGSALDRAKAS